VFFGSFSALYGVYSVPFELIHSQSEDLIAKEQPKQKDSKLMLYSPTELNLDSPEISLVKKDYKLDPAVKAVIQKEGLPPIKNVAVTQFAKAEVAKILGNVDERSSVRLEEERAINTEKAVIKTITEMRATGYKHPIERSLMMHTISSRGALQNLVVFDQSSTNIKINLNNPVSNLSNLNIIDMANAGIVDVSNPNEAKPYYNYKEIEQMTKYPRICNISTGFIPGVPM
jgi:hypothetical protein